MKWCNKCDQWVQLDENMCPFCDNIIIVRKRRLEQDIFEREDEWSESDEGQDIWKN